MPFKHVYAPTRGEVTNTPPTVLPPEASTYTKGMYLKDGEVVSDFGYVDFPTAGLLKTNELNGKVMRLDQFYLLDGTSHLLCFTTTSLYKYNTSTTTWDDITYGIAIDDCEDAWTDRSGDTTCSADTAIKLEGSKSSKMIVPAAVTQELIASWDTTSDLDCSSHRYLHFWVYLTVATTADQIRFRICEDDAGAATNTWCEWDIGALAKDTWHHVSIDLDGTPDNSNAYSDHTDLDSVDSIALYLEDTAWAGTVYIDDVRIVTQFTGDEDNRFSTTVMNDTFVITNGIDQTQKITESGGVLTVANLVTTLAAGTISTSEIVLAFKDHLCLMSNTENGANTPQRVSWTTIGSLEDYVTGTSGYQDLVDDESWIVAAEQIGNNAVIIYKERSVVLMYWVGGHTPLRFTTLIDGEGALSKDGIANIGGIHTVLGPVGTYEYNGGKEVKYIDDSIRDNMFDRFDTDYATRSFIMYVEEDDETQIWIPTDNTDPDEGWCYHQITESWYKKDRRILGFGFYQSQSALTIGDLIGTIGEQDWRFGDALTKSGSPITLVGDRNGKVYKLDKTTLNNDGIAITNEFQTPDFVLPDTPDYMNKFMRVTQLLVEARGSSITCSFSTDGGGTWSPCQSAGGSITLDSVYDIYQQDFDTVCRRVRFKFKNITASSGFRFRYYGFDWKLRSGRR